MQNPKQNPAQRFLPHVTVATVIERDGRFLLVQEQQNGQTVYNQPAGHLEANETLLQAAIRECREETAWEVELTGFLGVSLYLAPANQVTYVRHLFAGRPLQHYPSQPLDSGIVEAVWLTLEDLQAKRQQLRSPLVLDAIEQYLQAPHLPLEQVKSFGFGDSATPV